MDATLLVELLTEELPPRALAGLELNFGAALFEGLMALGLVPATVEPRRFSTPRRLAAVVPSVRAQAADRANQVQGPSVNAPPQAVEGFARKHGIAASALERRDTPKGAVFVANITQNGATLDAALGGIVGDAVRKLPIPKVMRWGAGDAQFVRPVHRLVMLHGERVVPGRVLGLDAGRRTLGHRFMGCGDIELRDADSYEAALRDQGMVVADSGARRAEIERQLLAGAECEGAALGEYKDLLEEVSALVEHPSVYLGQFDAKYLDVPQECLILTMRQNQKYFPLFDANGRLLPKFLIVSNMRLADPRHVIEGNQRVVRPRLEDARFFFDQDRKVRLETRVPQLARIVYHNKLGSQLERVQRIRLLAGSIARQLKADVLLAERASELSKADLLTGMVGEFPELQGVMGRQYALHDGEPPEVADAIEEHYRPRQAGGALPDGPLACAVSLADKLDTLAGMFGAGQQPSGDRDPFGLRRAALGVIRILVERRLALPLQDLIGAAFAGHARELRQVHADLETFVLERFSGYLRESGYSAREVDSVLSLRPALLNLVPRQLEAVRAFQALPEAESLAAANKRVANILRQAQAKGETFARLDPAELAEPAERALHEAIRATSLAARAQFDSGDYAAYLKAFAVLKAQVDAFFDSVMVMVEDEKLRRGRLALLAELRDAMNRVADLSKLAT